MTSSWFKSYLSHHTQNGIIKEEKSSTRTVNTGVPQGSVLGPILFLIYINDIVNKIESTIKLFADDTSMYLGLKDHTHRGEFLNSDFKKKSEWTKDLKVNFNETKTKLLNITRNKNAVPI